MDKKEQFEHWLFDMGDTLEAFFERFQEHKDKLDYSIDSLLVVEKLILEQYSHIDEVRDKKEAENLNQFAVYVGQTIRKNLGAKWSIELEHPKFAFYGLPVIINYSENSSPICPLTLVTASTDRRRGDYIKKIIQNKYDKLNKVSS